MSPQVPQMKAITHARETAARWKHRLIDVFATVKTTSVTPDASASSSVASTSKPEPVKLRGHWVWGCFPLFAFHSWLCCVFLCVYIYVSPCSAALVTPCIAFVRVYMGTTHSRTHVCVCVCVCVPCELGSMCVCMCLARTCACDFVCVCAYLTACVWLQNLKDPRHKHLPSSASTLPQVYTATHTPTDVAHHTLSVLADRVIDVENDTAADILGALAESKLWCVCQMPHADGVFMLACDSCDFW